MTPIQIKSVLFGVVALIGGMLLLLETERTPRVLVPSILLFFSLGILASNPFFEA